MTAIPEDKHGTAALINAAHEAAQEPPRPHMGCSLIGDPCERKLWLSFRWAVVERFDGRILRLFRRGQHEWFAPHSTHVQPKPTCHQRALAPSWWPHECGAQRFRWRRPQLKSSAGLAQAESGR